MIGFVGVVAMMLVELWSFFFIWADRYDGTSRSMPFGFAAAATVILTTIASIAVVAVKADVAYYERKAAEEAQEAKK